ncbi:hypothetical protein Tco_0778986 [Tanacetum coccineum]
MLGLFDVHWSLYIQWGVVGGKDIGGEVHEGKVWGDIVKIGEEVYRVGVDFTSSCIGGLGDGRDIRFWIDRWVDNRRLCDRFLRLYHLDMRKEVSVSDIRGWVNNRWVWEWDWVRSITGIDKDGRLMNMGSSQSKTYED